MSKCVALFSTLAFGTINVMPTITIPRKLANQDDLVVIPRKEYNALIQLKELKEFIPTLAQKKALVRAENNLRKGKTLSYDELVKKLGLAS